MSFAFDEKKYNKRMLDLSRSGVVDYYSRYALPPGCEDDPVIKAALEMVPKTWSKWLTNTRYEKIFRLFQEEHRNVAPVLLDPARRNQYFEDNKSKINTAIDEIARRFAASVNVLRAQGVATREQIDQIYRDFGASVPKEKIDTSLAGISVIDITEPPQMDKTTFTDMRGHLSNVEAKDLYDFLGLDRAGATRDSIDARNDERQREADELRDDQAASSMKRLCGLIKKHLLDADRRERYDNTLDMEQSRILEDEVQIAAKLGGIPVKSSSHLMARGQELGLSPDAARTVIIRTAVRLGVRVAFRGDQLPSCVACGLEIKGDPDLCPNCESLLRIQCPKCETLCRTYESTCKCGLAIDDMERIRGVEETWRLYLGLDLFSAVKSDLAWVVSKIGRTGWVADALKETERAQEGVTGLVDAYRRALREKNLCGARANLEELQTASPKTTIDGEPLGSLLDELKRQLRQVEQHVQQGRELEQKKQTDAAATQYQEAIRLASDCKEARDGLLRCPPEPPQGVVRVTLRPGVVTLSWGKSPSSGSIQYVVVRKSGRASTSATDGERLTETAGLQHEDKAFEVGKAYVYTIFASREAVCSPAGAASVTVVPTAEVKNLRLEPGDGVIQGTWEVPGPGVYDIKVTRKQNTEPRDLEDGDPVELTGQTTFLCKGLPNRQRLFFRVSAGYRMPDERIVWTPGVVANAVPTAPPPAVEDLTVDRDQAGLRFTWPAPAQGEVTVLRCSAQPETPQGATLHKDELLATGVPVRRSSAGESHDEDPTEGISYYCAVTVDGDLATMGASVRVANLPEVSELAARYLGSVIRCTWVWPGDSPKCAVAWRHDRFPIGHDEDGATVQILSAGQYDRKGSFEIPVAEGARDDHYIAVFAAGAGSQEDVFSGATTDGSKTLLPLGQGGTISYHVKPVKAKWKPRAASGYEVSLTSEKRLTVPSLLLVKFAGKREPTRPSAGEVVCRLPGMALGPERKHVEVLDAQTMGRRPFAVRLFFADEDAYDRFEIDHPPPKSRTFT